MRVLVVGGSGYVGGLVLPHLVHHHDIRVFDRKPPETDAAVEYTPGDVRDFDAVTAALDGVDSMIYMAMGPMSGWDSAAGAGAHFDVAVSGLYLCLRAGAEHGLRRVVYTSSMSVYGESGPVRQGQQGHQGQQGQQGRRYPGEDVPPDATDFYGFAKSLGELVCQNAVDTRDLSVVALRLCHPAPDDPFPPPGEHSIKTTISTSARDTARALRAGLDYGGSGFEPFAISGDAAGTHVPIDKARTVLGWEPLDPTA